MRVVEFQQLLEGVIADDIGVQYEKWGIIFSEGLFREFEWSSCAKGLTFDREGDFDIVESFVLLGSQSQKFGL